MEEELENGEEVEGLHEMKPVKLRSIESNKHGFDQKEKATYELMSVDS